MRATCPNDPSHKTFITTTHVMQEWVVDEHGEFLEEKDSCMEVVNGPDKDNIWECATCGCEADVE